MKDIFNLNSDSLSEEVICEIPSSEFVIKTKKLLTKLSEEYSKSWSNRELTDEEYIIYDEAINNAVINGNNIGDVNSLMLDGVETDIENSEHGMYIREFDSTNFVIMMDNLMFEQDDFFELIGCDIINK